MLLLLPGGSVFFHASKVGAVPGIGTHWEGGAGEARDYRFDLPKKAYDLERGAKVIPLEKGVLYD